MAIKIAINGFGRIGRLVLRAYARHAYNNDIDIVAINSPGPIETAVHLFQYDSVHGHYPTKVTYGDDWLDIGFGPIRYSRFKDPKDANWGSMNADIILECSGHFNNKDKASAHIAAGAKKVLVSAPCKNADATIVYGVNHDILTADDHVISNASCTTNCLAPVIKVLHDNFIIETGYMTTIHAYTGDQNIVDNSHKDLRRARAAALSMVPTSTGAARALGEVIPAMQGKLDGAAIRVPTANVSCVDITCVLSHNVTSDEVKHAFNEAANNNLHNVLGVNDIPLVSCDFNGSFYSSVVDLPECHVLGNNFVRVLSWYDNEWGFSCRMLDNVKEIATFI